MTRPGAEDFTAWTQPDGLWVSLLRGDDDAPVSAAVFAVEVSRSWQNLSDKRHRYATTHASLLLKVELDWLLEEVGVQHGGKHARWKLTEGWGEDAASPSTSLRLPLRSVRVLYALPNDATDAQGTSRMYEQGVRRLALEAHEYLSSHSALAPTNPRLRRLVARMMTPHFLQ